MKPEGAVTREEGKGLPCTRDAASTYITACISDYAKKVKAKITPIVIDLLSQLTSKLLIIGIMKKSKNTR